MRISRPRVTVRGLMVLVAVVALTLGAIMLVGRRMAYLGEAARHADLEAYFSEVLSELEGTAKEIGSRTLLARLPDGTEVRFRGYGAARKAYRPPDSSSPCDPATVKRLRDLCRERLAHEAQLVRKYADAASRPWVSVAPDPPEPK